MIAATVIGLCDSVGFYFTIRFFLKNSNKTGRMLMVGLELCRLVVLMGVVIVLIRVAHLNTYIVISMALFLSLAGKVLFALKGKSANVTR